MSLCLGGDSKGADWSAFDWIVGHKIEMGEDQGRPS